MRIAWSCEPHASLFVIKGEANHAGKIISQYRMIHRVEMQMSRAPRAILAEHIREMTQCINDGVNF